MMLKHLPIADYARTVNWILKYTKNTKVYFICDRIVMVQML